MFFISFHFNQLCFFPIFDFIHNVHSDGSHCILTVFVFYISFFESFPHQGVSRWWLAGWMVPLYHVDGWVQFSFWWMQWVIELSLNRVEADEWKKWVQRLNMHSTHAALQMQTTSRITMRTNGSTRGYQIQFNETIRVNN